MSDPATIVDASPIISAVVPYAAAFAAAFVAYLARQGLGAFTAWTGAKIDAAHSAAIEAACANEAGKLVAGAAGNLATAQIHVGNPDVAAAANAIVSASSPVLAKAVAATGLTPELAASIIVGQIGKMQAQMTSSAPTSQK